MSQQLKSAPVNSTDSMQPYISPDALDKNSWSGIATAYEVYKTQLNAAIPDQMSLKNIGSSTMGLPGSFNTMNAPAGVESSSLKNISLCSANLSNLSAGNYGSLASSLLPPLNSMKFEGQTDCEINKNELANQAFLSAVGQIGFNTNPVVTKNYDIRSLPPNPILNVSPWMNSTIMPDFGRRPLEEQSPSHGIYGIGPDSIANPAPINL